MKRKTIYYRDELNDEFSGVSRNTKVIDDKYKYLPKCWLWKACRFVVYRLVMTPFAHIYMKLKFGHKVIGKKSIKESRGKGIYVYGNHTLMAGDAFIPNIVCMPRDVYMLVHPDNISLPILGECVKMCGALPLPSTAGATRGFMSAIDTVISKGKVVQVYPEAHIWPYDTKTRPFKSVAFKYPVKSGAPVYAITNTYHKKKIGKTPKVITYVDGPFFADMTLPLKERQETLRDKVYEIMCSRAKTSTYEAIEYVKEENND